MSETVSGLRRKLGGAGDLQSVVRTMKAVAASNIGQYERSVRALADYYRTVELGLRVCLRERGREPLLSGRTAEMGPHTIGAVVFGSDQGLVGQFNEVVAGSAVKTLSPLSVEPIVWAVGERVHACLIDAGLPPLELLSVPSSVKSITPLVGQIVVESQTSRSHGAISELYLFYNSPRSGAAYAPVSRRLLPLDEPWQRRLFELPWQTPNLPEMLGGLAECLPALVREYLFVSLFRASAESLSSENASRLAAMERADQNIEELLVDLNRSFHELRQSQIDEELFDVISGFEALSREDTDHGSPY